MENRSQIKLEYCTITNRSDGILEQRFARETTYEVTKEDLIGFKKAFREVSKGQKMPLLTISGLYGSITKEAREVDINESEDYTLALGLVITELGQRLLANFYFKIKKVNYPVKCFKNEEDTIEWLHEQARLAKQTG